MPGLPCVAYRWALAASGGCWVVASLPAASGATLRRWSARARRGRAAGRWRWWASSAASPTFLWAAGTVARLSPLYRLKWRRP